MVDGAPNARDETTARGPRTAPRVTHPADRRWARLPARRFLPARGLPLARRLLRARGLLLALRLLPPRRLTPWRARDARPSLRGAPGQRLPQRPRPLAQLPHRGPAIGAARRGQARRRAGR